MAVCNASHGAISAAILAVAAMIPGTAVAQTAGGSPPRPRASGELQPKLAPGMADCTDELPQRSSSATKRQPPIVSAEPRKQKSRSRVAFRTP